MSLELTATLREILPVQSGSGRNGPWQKQDFIVESGDKYPKKVCCTLWGDKTNMLQGLQAGSELKVFFDVESREYNGRWYTDVKAWKIEPAGQSSGGGAPSDDIPPPGDDDLPVHDDDDLPF